MTDSTTYWKVYKGASFDLWNPDTDVYYASVRADEITKHLQKKRQRSHQHARSRSANSPSSGSTTQRLCPASIPASHFGT